MQNWIDLLEPAARESGADVFLVEHAVLSGESATVTFKLYFGGQKFIKKNALSEMKGSTFYFDPHNTVELKTLNLPVKEQEQSVFLYERGEEGKYSLNARPQGQPASAGMLVSYRRSAQPKGSLGITAYDASLYCARRQGMFVYNQSTLVQLPYKEGRMLMDIYAPVH